VKFKMGPGEVILMMIMRQETVMTVGCVNVTPRLYVVNKTRAMMSVLRFMTKTDSRAQRDVLVSISITSLMGPE
jgi:hypothetical protein